ncbi:MAG: FISUMP domain-containing protein [Paludibacter sp.]
MAAKNGWLTSTTVGTIGNDLTKNNSSKFTALPSGYRGWSGIFDLQTKANYTWTSSLSADGKAWYRSLNYGNNVNSNKSDNFKYYGFSVRCIMN